LDEFRASNRPVQVSAAAPARSTLSRCSRSRRLSLQQPHVFRVLERQKRHEIRVVNHAGFGRAVDQVTFGSMGGNDVAISSGTPRSRAKATPVQGWLALPAFSMRARERRSRDAAQRGWPTTFRRKPAISTWLYNAEGKKFAFQPRRRPAI
jgi:hypothetical protein